MYYDDYYLCCWSIDPNVNEGQDPIEDSEEYDKEKTKQKDETVVDDELDVFVHEAQDFIIGGDGFRTLVLKETFLEFQLYKDEGE